MKFGIVFCHHRCSVRHVKVIQAWSVRIGMSVSLLGVLAAEAASLSGVVFAWGAYGDGQTNVPIGLTNAVAIAAGSYHGLGLGFDGTVVAWGGGTNGAGHTNNYGQTLVPASATNVTAIAAGRYHSVALKGGGVLAWGAGTSNTVSSPHYGQSIVPASATGVASITAGGFHTLALKSNGTVVAWATTSSVRRMCRPL
jgi:alpha-tubulin suppressor-like RCC1 family protein